MPIFVFPPPFGFRLNDGQGAMTHRRRGFGLPVVPHSPVIFQRQLPRRNGPPGVNTYLSARERRVYLPGL